MRTLLKSLRLTVVIVTVPLLAAAADAPPAAVAQPGIVAPPQKETTPPAPGSGPSEPAVARHTFRIGYVSMGRIIEETRSGKALQEQFKQQKDKLQAKVYARRKQLDKLRASLEAKLPTLTPPQREAKYREFQKKVEEFQKMAKESEEELVKLQESGTKALIEETERASRLYGKANGLSAIVVRKELLYIGDGVDAQDISEAIIKALNGSAEKK